MKKSSRLIKYFGLITLNIVFWIVSYLFFTYFLGYGSNNTEYVNSFSGYLMPVTIILSYFIILYLIPNYLLRKRYLLFGLYLVYTFIISFAAILISIFYGLILSSYLKDIDSQVLTKSLPLIVLGIYFVVTAATLISLLFYSYLFSLKNEELNNKILSTQLELKEQELTYLKMQIHPHFLFNSLNTIYGMALARKEKTPEVILKLSNLLDYILYQIKKPEVNLIDELDHIKNYLDLEHIRFYDTLEINYDENIDNKKSKIPPMLLLPFVENSFKHGSIIDNKLIIDIRVKLLNNCFDFWIENSFEEKNNNSKGLGLMNIRRRLEMIYSDQFDLKTHILENSYKVHLHLKLKK